MNTTRLFSKKRMCSKNRTDLTFLRQGRICFRKHPKKLIGILQLCITAVHRKNSNNSPVQKQGETQACSDMEQFCDLMSAVDEGLESRNVRMELVLREKTNSDSRISDRNWDLGIFPDSPNQTSSRSIHKGTTQLEERLLLGSLSKRCVFLFKKKDEKIENFLPPPGFRHSPAQHGTNSAGRMPSL